jgi:SAM-dependent methyltransferase
MCRRYPRLKATIYDLESPSEFGRQLVAEAGLTDRIRFVTGDVNAVADFGPTVFDVIFCFNLVHHLQPHENVNLIRKAAQALRPQGAFAIWDEFQDESLKEEAFGRLVGLMFLLASGGNTVSFNTVMGWMQNEGISSIKQFRIRSAPGTGLLCGWKH